MPEPLSDDIRHKIGQAGDLYYRLVLLVAPPGSGKTAALEEVARRFSYRYVNVGLELSRRLLEVAARERPVLAPRLLEEIAAEGASPVVLLDNTEVLFDPSLRLDPLRLLQHLSRQRTVVAAWSGTLARGHLTYAAPGHREYRRYPAKDLLLVVAAPA